MTPPSMCKGGSTGLLWVWRFFTCRWISTTTCANQQCYLSGLGLYSDGEDGKFSVSFTCPPPLLVYSGLGDSPLQISWLLEPHLRVCAAQQS